LRVNEAIRAREVRLINFDGKHIGIVPIEQARRAATEAGLDLVEVASDAEPPVCKIVDYRKVAYEQKKRERQGRAHRRHVEIKEIKIRPTIDRHDYEIKARHAREFLTLGHKVKITIMFRYREMARPEVARNLLQRIADELADIAAVEDRMAQIGRQHQMILVPASHHKASAAKPDVEKAEAQAPSAESGAGGSDPS